MNQFQLTVLLSAAAIVSGSVASAEEVCPKIETHISGYLSQTTAVQGKAKSLATSTADEPEVIVPVPQEVNSNRSAFVLRFVHSAANSWTVAVRSPLVNEDASKPLQFVSPMAVVNFDRDGMQIGEQIIKAYLPGVDNDQKKAEFVLTLTGLVTGAAEAKLNVETRPSTFQVCPEVGKTDVTAEQAKMPEYRMRIFDADGRDITDLGYDEFGPLSSVE